MIPAAHFRGDEMGRSRWVRLAFVVSVLACGGPSEKQADANAQQPQATPSPGTAPANETAVRGDWLVFHALSDPENLNPLTSNDSIASSILGWIFPSLMYVDPKTLELKPAIAKAPPETTPDHLQYVYTLRTDVTFSDDK